jgi:hypothetical protein
MRRHAKWVFLLMAFAPGCLPSGCEADCSGDGDRDCLAVTGPSVATPPTVSLPASTDPLALSCAARNVGADAQLEWEITIGGGGPPYAYSIDFGDGTSAAAGAWPTSGAHQGLHAYARPGDFQVTAQVRDAGGRAQSCGMAVIAPAPGLELQCSATPRSGAAPLRVAFDVPPGGRRGCIGPCTVSWSFGDGGEGEGGHAVHEYTATGPATYDAVATLRDGLDRAARCRVPIEVAGVAPTPNRPPVIDAFTASPASLTGGHSSALSGAVSDPDPGDTTTWSLSLGGNPSAGTLSPASGSGPIAATFASASSASGDVTIVATAVDSHGASTQRSVTVSLSPNHAPVITSLTANPPLVFAQPGGFSSIRGTIMDPDGDPVTWLLEVMGGPCSMPTLSGSGTSAAGTVFIPPSLGGGTCAVRLTARDSAGLTAARTVTVVIVPAP